MNNLLIVEDDKELNELVCSYFENNDYFVTGCFNGLEALKLLEKQKFDLILNRRKAIYSEDILRISNELLNK